LAAAPAGEDHHSAAEDEMRTPRLPFALFLAASLIGCQREQPSRPESNANAAEIKPFLVKTNTGIDHEFYRGISLDEFLKILPTGSVDSVDLDFSKGPQVYALVKVPDQIGKDLTKIRFETIFKTQDGRSIEKHWTAAKGRTSGKSMAMFCLPVSVVEGQTKILSGG
jgi:hypothetical protein